MKAELLPEAYRAGSAEWEEVVRGTGVDLTSPGESSFVAVLIPAVGSGTYRMVRVVATRSELIVLAQQAMQSVVQAALQRPFVIRETGIYDCETASAMPIVGDIVGGNAKGSPILGFRELSYLLGSHQGFQRSLVALAQGRFEADGAMMLLPGSFVAAVPPGGCSQWTRATQGRQTTSPPPPI